MKKVMLFLMLIVLLSACSANTTRDIEGSTEYITRIDTSGLSYDYNQGGTALLSLDKANVTALLEMDSVLKEKITKEELWLKVSNLFDQSFVVAEGYFPKGDQGKFTLDVIDGQIDLSDYNLEGDLNHDGAIDQGDIDLMLDALVSNNTNGKIDLTGDGTLDTKDLVYLSARLLTDATSFSFYTEAGDKLEVAPVPYQERGFIKEKAFAELSKVSVLVNDINGDNQLEYNPNMSQANKTGLKKPFGMQTSLAHIYSKKVTDHNDKRAYEKEELFKAFIRETTEFIRKQKIDKYLTSWTISFEVMDVVNEGGVYSQVSGGMDSFKNRIDRMVEDELVREHFEYDMGVFKRAVTHSSYILHLGKHSGSKDALTSHVNAVRNSETRVITSPASGNRYYKSIVTYATVYYTEAPVMAIEGDLTIEGWTNPSGKIKFTRLGPGYDHTFEKEYDIQDGKFRTGNDLATGEYRVDYYVPGQKIMYTLFGDTKDNTFIFVGNENAPSKVNWNIKSGGITIYGVIEENGEPLEGKEVLLTPQFKDSGVKDTQKVLTDDEGKYKIENVPFGAYDVLVGEEGSSKEEKVKKQEIGAVDPKADGDLERLLGGGLSNTKDKQSDEDAQLEWEAESHGMSMEEYKKFKESENNRSDFEDPEDSEDSEDSGEEVDDGILNMLEALMKSLLSWFADWDSAAIEVPTIEYQSTYDIELVWKVEDFLVTSKWYNIPLTESSKVVSEYNSQAYVVSEKEDLHPDYFHIENLNSQTKDKIEFRFDPADLTLSVYKIAEDMTLTREDLMNMESEEPLEDFEVDGESIDGSGMDMFGAMLDHFDFSGEFKKDTLYIEIDLYYEWGYKEAKDDLGMEIFLPYATPHLQMMPENLLDDLYSGYIAKSDFERLTANDHKYADYIKKKSEGPVSYTLTIKTHKKD